jgi:hypothetical protein
LPVSLPLAELQTTTLLENEVHLGRQLCDNDMKILYAVLRIMKHSDCWVNQTLQEDVPPPPQPPLPQPKPTAPQSQPEPPAQQQQQQHQQQQQ